MLSNEWRPRRESNPLAAPALILRNLLKTTEAQNDQNPEYPDVWYTTGTRHFHHFIELQRMQRFQLTLADPIIALAADSLALGNVVSSVESS